MKIVKTSILMVLLMAVLAITPAMAFLDETTTVASNSVSHGSHNYLDARAYTATDGSVIDMSDKSQLYTDASTTIVNEAPKPSAYYYGFDTPIIDKTFITVYAGQVVVVPNNKDESVFSKSGDVWKYTIQSSQPVLAYVIDSVDTERAKWDTNCAPKYDPVADKFTVGNLDKIYISTYRSTQQQFEVTIPDDESSRYSLVIDTRVTTSKNGIFNPIIDDRTVSDSIDLVVSMQQVKDGAPEDSVDYKPKMTTFLPDPATYIGKIDIFPTYSDGSVNTNN